LEFRFTEEQELLRRSVRDFAESEIGPHVMTFDEAQEFPLAIVKKAAEQGYYGVLFPESLGGAGLGYVEYVIVVEELSRVDGSIGISAAAHNSLCTNHIFACGNDAQRKAYVPRLASGEWIGAWSLTEPTAGSDAGGTKTTAKPVPGGGWILNGRKAWITNAAIAGVFTTLVQIDPSRLRIASVSYRPRPRHALVTVSAVDTAGRPISRAAVRVLVSLSGRHYFTGRATTGAAGKTVFRLPVRTPGCYRTTIRAVSAPGFACGTEPVAGTRLITPPIAFVP
jgi:alkylation response protein AidB-like acyl-CoA dehydrogenase